MRPTIPLLFEKVVNFVKDIPSFEPYILPLLGASVEYLYSFIVK